MVSRMIDMIISIVFSVMIIGICLGNCSWLKIQVGSVGLFLVRKKVMMNLFRLIVKFISSDEMIFGIISGRIISWNVLSFVLFRLQVVFLSEWFSELNVVDRIIVVQGMQISVWLMIIVRMFSCILIDSSIIRSEIEMMILGSIKGSMISFMIGFLLGN